MKGLKAGGVWLRLRRQEGRQVRQALVNLAAAILVEAREGKRRAGARRTG